MLSGFFTGSAKAGLLVAGAAGTEAEAEEPVTSGLEGTDTGPDTGIEPHPTSKVKTAQITQTAEVGPIGPIGPTKRSRMGLISGGFFWLGFAFFFGQRLNVQKHFGFGGVSIV